MSLILDALRKSEHQRQRQVGPGLAVVAEGRESRRPATWLLVVGGLLLLNVLVLVAILLTGRQTDQAAAVTRPPPVVSPGTSPTAPAAQSPAETRPAPARTAPVPLPSRPPRDEVRPLTTEVAAAPAQPPVARPAPPPSENGAAGAAPRTTPPPASVEQATDDARLPRFTNLVVRGELNVPHMHIDIHVFNTVPAERFVFINMRKYGEGEATQEGPRIERITRDGVVMDYQGQRFFLSRD
jgi:general secretion pathway protein B